jgi:hypothetical protein
MSQNNSTNAPNRAQSPPDYESVCQSVGHLFIESSLAKKRVESSYSSLISDLTAQIEELIEENENLKSSSEDKS